MGVSQISVFIESRPGHMSRVLESFDEARVSVRGYSASDTGDYGIVRFIVDDPDNALSVLEQMGAAAAKTEVLCLRLADKPGELARIMGIMARNNINVVYSYSLDLDLYRHFGQRPEGGRGYPSRRARGADRQSDLVGYFDSVEAQGNALGRRQVVWRMSRKKAQRLRPPRQAASTSCRSITLRSSAQAASASAPFSSHALSTRSNGHMAMCPGIASAWTKWA